MLATYNEFGNIKEMVRQIRQNHLDADIEFVDDNSPDGTGEIVNEISEIDKRIFLITRPGKQGIGSAHQRGIAWAYEQGYTHLVTMDCDFAHSPSQIRDFVERAEEADLLVGNRFMGSGSLTEWSFYRKFLTHLGHKLTRVCLGFEYDATGAFRLYRLDRIDRRIFGLVISDSYSFF